MLPAERADRFSERMMQQGWQLTQQEAGQTHFIGWGYRKTWQYSTDAGQAVCTLLFEDQQGVQRAHCEYNPLAQALLAPLWAEFAS